MIEVVVEFKGDIDEAVDEIAVGLGGFIDIGGGANLETGVRDIGYETKDERKAVKFAQRIARKWDGVKVTVKGPIFEKGNLRGYAREKK